ncbi:Uu.00g110650.m01.CDS01 [Anthostomella pinea]|uniref:Uu.00g110650.m01.CDS01 n=1 Tax=Anthostomella pinea TaxID=933095 RepID=A0AAI8VF07_9PEZI|nr:Uu.00g110650.m01.CDS01 [Anthostomella pinea]
MDANAAESTGGSPPSTSSRRACDQCRLRKIRCDKESPCSNCRSAKRSCCSTGAGQRPKEPRQRVLISSQYERKIDQIEVRLSSIEALLRNLAAQSTPLGLNSAATAAAAGGGRQTQPPTVPSTAPRQSSETSTFSRSSGPTFDKLTPATSSGGRGAASGGGGDGGTEAASSTKSTTIFDPEDADSFEGNSSLAAHTAFASEFLADAVQRTSLRNGGPLNPKIDAALDSLRQLVDMQKNQNRPRSDTDVSFLWESRWPSQKHFAHTNLRDLPLPPMAMVVDKLREMKHGPVPVMLAVMYSFTDIDNFIDRCRRLYFSTDDPPESTFILVNAGLTYVFFEAALAAADRNPQEKAQYDACRDMCQRNLEVALAQMNLMMPATAEHIEALLMGASFCIDVSRASLAWLLVSRATHMCRTLGYHQAHTMRDDDAQTKADKSLLFWCVYMLDKALSLRLGRASVMQDYDISLPHVVPDAKAAYPGKEVMALWIQHAQALGRIYERLYSPGALRAPDAARREQAAVLAAEQHRLMTESDRLLREFELRTDAEGRMFALTLKSDEVSYMSNLTLTYRALPPAPGGRSMTFCDECVDMARRSMRCHQEAMEMMDDQSLKIVYIHWTILYAPFIPFIVIFCLVIETAGGDGADDDLQRLADFVQSLEPAVDVSPSVHKLYQLCLVLHNIATLYVEAKKAQALREPNTADHDMMPGVSTEFDLYLSQLGFMPPVVDYSQQLPSSGGGVRSGGGMAPSDGMDSSMGVDDQTMRSIAQTNQLGDWFSGNNYMMGLLEEDLSGITPSGWPS